MALPHDDQELLSRILHFYRGELLENPGTHEDFRQLGLAEAALLESLAVGVGLGGLTRMLPRNEATLSAAKALGFLDQAGSDRFTRHLILPLRSHKSHLTGYGAIDLESRAETLVLFEPFGCLYPSEIRESRRVCLAASPLSALLLARLGEKAVLLSSGREIMQHLSHLSEFSFREAVLAFDDAGLIQTTARALSIQGIEPLGFSLAHGEKLQDALLACKADDAADELFTQIAPVAAGPERPEIRPSEEGLHFNWPDRSYRVRLVEPNRFDHLRVSVKLTKGPRWHLDTIDLGLAKQRQTFIHMARKVVRMEAALLYHDLLLITDEVERCQAERILQTSKEAPVNEETRREAEEFLANPAMFDQLAEDFRALGWLGDPNAAFLGYLTLTSRKLRRPLAMAWAEGAEPVKLPSVLLPLLPPEDLVYLTRSSPKALLYQDEEALSNRLIAAETHTLSSEVSSCLAKLAAGEELRAQVVIREAQTGRLRTATHRVKGPCALFLIVPKNGQMKLPGAPFLPVRGFEEIPGAEEDAWFLHRAKGDWHEEDALRERIVARHRAAQRLLRPCAVRNPHAGELLEKERDPVRRQRLEDLAEAIAFLRQRQKQVQSGKAGEYVEVSPDDIRLAENLAGILCGVGWPTLNAGAERVLAAIRAHLDGTPSAVFTRSDVISWTGLGLTAAREHLDRLEAEGHLIRVKSRQNRAVRYQLTIDTPIDTPRGCQIQEPQPQMEQIVVRAPAHLAPLAPHNGSG